MQLFWRAQIAPAARFVVPAKRSAEPGSQRGWRFNLLRSRTRLGVSGIAVLLTASSALASCSGRYPNRILTPGAILTQDAQIVCKYGYLKGLRRAPPETKRQVYERYGISPESKDCVIDHFIPLELGGSNDIKNLWPQPWPGYDQKDLVENYLSDEVCQGRMTLPEAQQKISSDWYAVYKNITEGRGKFF